MKNTLYEHNPIPHIPRNVNQAHDQECATFNQRVAVALTRAVGTMVCAYIFFGLAIAGFPGFHASLMAYVQWTSQTLIQLVMLSVIMVGQSLLGRKQELMAEEQFSTTVKTYDDTEQIMQHLTAQDEAILKLTSLVTSLMALLPTKTTDHIGDIHE